MEIENIVNLITATKAENEIFTGIKYNEKIKILVAVGHIKNEDNSYTTFIKFFNDKNELIKTSHGLKQMVNPNSKVLDFDNKFLIAKSVSGRNRHIEISLSVIDETLNIALMTNLSLAKEK